MFSFYFVLDKLRLNNAIPACEHFFMLSITKNIYTTFTVLPYFFVIIIYTVRDLFYKKKTMSAVAKKLSGEPLLLVS